MGKGERLCLDLTARKIVVAPTPVTSVMGRTTNVMVDSFMRSFSSRFNSTGQSGVRAAIVLGAVLLALSLVPKNGGAMSIQVELYDQLPFLTTNATELPYMEKI